MRLLVGKTMVIYDKHGLGCVWRNLLLHKMSGVSIWAGLISEGPETQSGAVPELIKEAWCRVPVKMWLCDVVWFGGAVFYQPGSVPMTGRQSNWHLGTGILETRFKVPPSKIWCLMLVAPVISQFQLSVCLRYQKVKQKSYREVQDLHLSTFLLIFKDGTAQWRMKNYGTAHFRGQSWRNIFSWASSSWNFSTAYFGCLMCMRHFVLARFHHDSGLQRKVFKVTQCIGRLMRSEKFSLVAPGKIWRNP